MSSKDARLELEIHNFIESRIRDESPPRVAEVRGRCRSATEALGDYVTGSAHDNPDNHRSQERDQELCRYHQARPSETIPPDYCSS